MEKIVAAIVILIVVLALVGGLSLLLTFPVMWAINWLFAPAALTAVFGASQLTFWKAFVLTYVCGALFSSTHIDNK